MGKWKQGVLIFIVAVCFGLFVKLPVHATSTSIDFSKNGTGSLTIRFETVETEDEEGNIVPSEGVPGARFTIYLVEELFEDNGVQKLKWAAGFESCNISLQNLSNSQSNQAAKSLEAYADQNSIQGMGGVTDILGCVTYKDLKFGTYLVVLTDVSDRYKTIDPFLISVPLERDGALEYDVLAIPKTGKFPRLDLDEPDEPDGPEVLIPPTTESELEPGKLPQTGPARWMIPVFFGASLIVFVVGWKLLKKNAGKFLMTIGVLLFASMIGITVYQNYTERLSEAAAVDLLAAYEARMGPEDGSIKPSDEVGIIRSSTEDADDMDYVVIDEEDLIGEISIPAIDITLPVIKECTSSSLKKAPCRYKGNAKESSMIISAHNYGRHFGKISLLKAGDEVIFTDVDGVEYSYEVVLTETLGAYDVEQMLSGEWDLTLFTCTYGGQNRITVRCSRLP